MDTPPENDAPKLPYADVPPETIPVARPATIPVARAANNDPMLLERLSPAQSAMHLGILFTVFTAYMLLAGVAIGLTSAGDDTSEFVVSPGINLAITLVGESLIITVVVVLLRRRGYGLRAIGLSARRLGVHIYLGIGVMACSFGIFICTVQAMAVLWPAGYVQLQANAERVEVMLPPLSLPGMFVLMLGIGLFEELIFRGILLTHIRRITGSWTAAIIVSGVIFALLHLGDQEPAVTIPLFFVSVLWSVFTIWRRSLVPAIVGHALFNFFQFLALQ